MRRRPRTRRPRTRRRRKSYNSDRWEHYQCRITPASLIWCHNTCNSAQQRARDHSALRRSSKPHPPCTLRTTYHRPASFSVAWPKPQPSRWQHYGLCRLWVHAPRCCDLYWSHAAKLAQPRASTHEHERTTDFIPRLSPSWPPTHSLLVGWQERNPNVFPRSRPTLVGGGSRGTPVSADSGRRGRAPISGTRRIAGSTPVTASRTALAPVRAGRTAERGVVALARSGEIRGGRSVLDGGRLRIGRLLLGLLRVTVEEHVHHDVPGRLARDHGAHAQHLQVQRQVVASACARSIRAGARSNALADGRGMDADTC